MFEKSLKDKNVTFFCWLSLVRDEYNKAILFIGYLYMATK